MIKRCIIVHIYLRIYLFDLFPFVALKLDILFVACVEMTNKTNNVK